MAGAPMTSKKAAAEGELRASGVNMLVLFGSAVTKAKKPADADVAVFLTDEARRRVRGSFDEQFEIIKAVANFLGQPVDDVDAVFVGPDTSPLLAFHIARDGRLLYGDERDFMTSRLRAVKVYQDAWKFREATRRYLKNAYA